MRRRVGAPVPLSARRSQVWIYVVLWPGEKTQVKRTRCGQLRRWLLFRKKNRLCVRRGDLAMWVSRGVNKTECQEKNVAGTACSDCIDAGTGRHNAFFESEEAAPDADRDDSHERYGCAHGWLGKHADGVIASLFRELK